MIGADREASGTRRLHAHRARARRAMPTAPARTDGPITKDLTMKYMLLIYSSPDLPQGTPDEQAADMQRWFDYSDEMAAAGVMVAGDPLEGVETSTTVRIRNDEKVLTDGPFAETKEVLGGYYIVDVDDLDEAIAWAVKSPAAHYGSMEVRPPTWVAPAAWRIP